MTQLDYTFTNGQAGTPGANAQIVSVPNPVALGSSDLDINAGADDGDYTVGLYVGTTKLAAATFAASSNTAAQIAAGITAAILAEPTFSGYVKSAAVHDTDETLITYLDPSLNLYLVIEADPSTDLLVDNTAPAPKTVLLGQILQADGAGGWTLTYTDASLALGAVCRSSEDALPFDGVDPGGPTSPCVLALVKSGDLNVPVEAGVTVLRGEKVAYSPTTKTWRNNVTGTWVLVEGAQWQTAGTGVQRVSLRFPSET